MQDKFISLANKYRPQTFEDMVGQDTISKTLTNAIKMNRIGHAYLFYGPRGCGKTTTARIFAKALNCTGHGDKPAPVPCGKCPQCIEIARSSDIDVLELDAASNTQVEKIREAIIDTVSLSSTRDRFKIFILDEVHMLSDSSFNALLKTVEEPPSHVVFILATTERHKVPATIASRCQVFRFRPITAENIESHLTDLATRENIKIDAKAVSLLAKNAGGAMRDAVTLLDRAIAYSDGNIDDTLVSEMLGLMPEDLLKDGAAALLHKDGAALHKVFNTLGEEGYDPLSFLRDLKNALGEIFYAALGQGKGPFEGADTLAKEFNPGFIAGLTRKINSLIEETKFSDTPLISAEVGLFNIMENCIDIESLVKRLEAVESGGVPPASSSSAPAPKKEIKTEAAAAPKKEVKVMPAKVNISVSVEKEMPAQAAAFAPAASALNNNQIWEKIKASFHANPFVSDALNNCFAEFDGAGQCNIIFDEDKSYYKTAAEMKAAEFAAKAQEICGRKIKFNFIVNSAASAAKTTAKEPAGLEPRTAPAKAEPLKKDDFIISKEQPFAEGVFVEDSPAPAKKSGPVPEDVKNILSMFQGEIIE